VTDVKRRGDQRYPIVGSVDDHLFSWTENGEHVIGDDRNDFNLENIPAPAPTPPMLTQRTESILLTPPSEPIFSEATIRIKIDDEAAGEFLMFESLSNDGKLRLDSDEWPAFKAGVEFMLSEIEKHKKL